MDSKWGGKTETINMQLNVEQVCENLMMYYHIKDLENCQLLKNLQIPKTPDDTCIHVASLLFEHGHVFKVLICICHTFSYL